MRRTLEIGKLSKRIELLRLAEGEDDLGQSTQKFQTTAIVWGDVRPVRGSEYYEIKKIQSKVTHKVYIRYYSAYADINSNWYLRCEGKVFDIDSVIDVDFEHKYFEIRCYERVNKEGHDEVVEPEPEETQETPTEDPETQEVDNG